MTHASGPAANRHAQLNKTLWMQALLPLQLSRVAADVCHFTNSVASWWTPCPAVVTIHDTTLWTFPRYHPRRRLLAMRPLHPTRRAARPGDHRRFSRDQARRGAHPGRSRIKGARDLRSRGAAFPAARPLRLLASVRHSYGLPASFILYVGTIEPRKNLVAPVAAFTSSSDSRAAAPHALVLVGHRGWNDAAILASVEQPGTQRRRARARARANRGPRGALQPGRRAGASRPCTRASACRLSRRWPAARQY